MAAVIYTEHFAQFFDNNGDPLSGGKLYAYSAGTTTPKPTFTTADGDVENAHPIVLDSAGRATVFIEGSYRFDLFDSNDVLIDSTDDITSFSTLQDAGDPFFQSFSGDGSTTVFTLSESLGSDSKDIMVFVNNEANDVGYEIQNPSAYTLSGTALTFSSAPPTGTNSIYVFAPTKLLGAASTAAGLAESAQTAAEAARDEAQAAAGLLDITSTTSLAIGTGTKVFTVDSGLGLTAGQFIVVVSDADSANYMWGVISSYAGTTLTVDVQATGGSGTLADWTMSLTGERGEVGAAGGISGGTLTGNIDGDATYKLVNMADGTSAQDYVTKAQLDGLSVGGWVPIQTQTVTSAVASVDFTTGIDGTYKAYAVVFSGVKSTSSNNTIYVRTSSDGGVTFDSSSGDYDWLGIYQRAGSTSPSGEGSGSDTFMVLQNFNSLSGNASASMNGFLKFFNPSNASLNTSFLWDLTYQYSAGELAHQLGAGHREAAGVVDAIRFYGAAGSLNAGTFTLYGLAGA